MYKSNASKDNQQQYPTTVETTTTTFSLPPPSYVIATNDNRDRDDQGCTGWCERQQKHKPQSNSVASGIMLIMASGLHIGWGVFRLYPFGNWSLSLTALQHFFVIAVFYIGTNIGSAIGAKLNNVLEKKKIYYICAILNIISSLTYMIGYNEMAAIFIGRIFAGFAFGITYLITIIHASENCVKEIRGLLLSSINYCMVTSIYIIMAFNVLNGEPDIIISPSGEVSTSSIGTNLDFWTGTLTLIYAILAILLTPFLTYESIIYLILKGQDGIAINNMKKLRNESVETWAIRRDYQEIKTMIEEDKNENQKFCSTESTAFIIVLLTKILSSISTMMAVNMLMLTLSITEYKSYQTGFLILLIPRFVTAIIPILTSDFIGRRKLIIFSGLSSGICLFLIGILLFVFQNEIQLPTVLYVFVLMYQAFIGFGINSIPDILMSEAFSSIRKADSIRFLIIIEYIIQIIGVVIFVRVTITIQYFFTLSIVLGIFMIGITIAIALVLPETKLKSLRESRKLFRKFTLMGRQ